VESKTFGKVKDEAFTGMMIAVITSYRYRLPGDTWSAWDSNPGGLARRESETPPHEPNVGLAASGFHWL